MTADRSIEALHFDGRSAAPRPVRLHVDRRELCIESSDGAPALRVALKQVQWPEATRHGVPVAHLPEGGSLRPAPHVDAAAWRDWLHHAGQRPSLVVRAQQNWRATLAALLLLVLTALALYQWGVPLAARGLLAVLPASVDEKVGELTLSSLQERGWLKPSTLAPERQQALREAFDAAVRRTEVTHPGAMPAQWQLDFAASKPLGANAFALPGGSIVVTDALAQLLADRDDVMLGVLGHEAGHVRERHGMRLLLQAALLTVATSVAFGDFSSVAATAPALLGHLAYSRDFERDADAHAIGLMQANGIPPKVMTVFFERLRALPDAPDREALGIGLASHPPDAERIRAFEQASLSPGGD